jgi:hypothetical protein
MESRVTRPGGTVNLINNRNCLGFEAKTCGFLYSLGIGIQFPPC